MNRNLCEAWSKRRLMSMRTDLSTPAVSTMGCKVRDKATESYLRVVPVLDVHVAAPVGSWWKVASTTISFLSTNLWESNTSLTFLLLLVRTNRLRWARAYGHVGINEPQGQDPSFCVAKLIWFFKLNPSFEYLLFGVRWIFLITQHSEHVALNP